MFFVGYWQRVCIALCFTMRDVGHLLDDDGAAGSQKADTMYRSAAVPNFPAAVANRQ
jgi:hypothetical protein